MINHEYVEHCHKDKEIHKHGEKVEVQDNKVIRKKDRLDQLGESQHIFENDISMNASKR